MFAGSSAALPDGPSGSPTSVEPTTSPARVPSACPIWEPNIAPPMERIMPSSGPVMACISSGSTSPIAPATRSATGSTSSFHTGSVASTHSARLHATAVLAPEGSEVAPSSHRSARRTASWTQSRSARPDARVLHAVRGALGDGLPGDVLGHVPVHGTAVVGEHLPELLEGGAEVTGVHGAEHRGEGVVPAGAAEGIAAAEAERIRLAASLA